MWEQGGGGGLLNTGHELLLSEPGCGPHGVHPDTTLFMLFLHHAALVVCALDHLAERIQFTLSKPKTKGIYKFLKPFSTKTCDIY